MSRNRFDQLNQSWSCNDPGKDPQKIRDKGHRFIYMRTHPLYPLQPIWDEVRKRCLQKYHPQKDLSIDEAMIKYRGFKANVKKIFMPLKPIKVGFKVYALAEAATGYLINFKIHPFEGASMPRIVMYLLKHHRGLYHHIYTDRLYTSVSLARDLLAVKTYHTGAVKSSSKGLPRDLLRVNDNPDRRRIEEMVKTPVAPSTSARMDPSSPPPGRTVK